MRCPVCGFEESKVVDSRSAEDGNAIRRRRECLGCRYRFTTYERLGEHPLSSLNPMDRQRRLTGKS